MIAIISQYYIKAFIYARENQLVRGEYHIIQTHTDLDGKCFDKVIILDIPKDIIVYIAKWNCNNNIPSLDTTEQKLKELMEEFHQCDNKQQLEWIYLR